MNVATFERLFVRLQQQDFWIHPSVFSDFQPQNNRNDAARFLEKGRSSQAGAESRKNGKKSGFGGFEKNLINLCVPFFTWIWK